MNVLLHHLIRLLRGLTLCWNVVEESRLRHTIRIRILAGEVELIFTDGLGAAEEAPIHDETGINAFSNSSIAERITMDLGMPWVFGVEEGGDLWLCLYGSNESDHDLV